MPVGGRVEWRPGPCWRERIGGWVGPSALLISQAKQGTEPILDPDIGDQDNPPQPASMATVAPSFPALMEIGLERLNVLLAASHEITPGVGPKAESKSKALAEGIRSATDDKSKAHIERVGRSQHTRLTGKTNGTPCIEAQSRIERVGTRKGVECMRGPS